MTEPDFELWAALLVREVLIDTERGEEEVARSLKECYEKGLTTRHDKVLMDKKG